MRTINTILVEEVYNESFEKIKEVLRDQILKELDDHLDQKTIEDYFHQMSTDSDVKGFIEQDNIKKIKDILEWFKWELWTLSGPVYDFARDDEAMFRVEEQMPTESFEIVTSNTTNRWDQFNYLVPITEEPD